MPSLREVANVKIGSGLCESDMDKLVNAATRSMGLLAHGVSELTADLGSVKKSISIVYAKVDAAHHAAMKHDGGTIDVDEELGEQFALIEAYKKLVDDALKKLDVLDSDFADLKKLKGHR